MKLNFENINWDLMSKILTEEASEEETVELEKWLAIDSQNKQVFNALAQIGHNIDIIKSVNKLDVESALKKLKKENRNVKFINFKKWTRIAAMLIVALGVIFILRYTLGVPKMMVVETLKGQRTEIILSDGSEISINENSKFTYPKRFRGQSRNVKLMGEAFFKVTPDKTKPFIVDLNETYVKVLGTQFNINNKQGASEISVLLTEGSVLFGHEKNNKDSIVLSKGNTGIYNKESQTLHLEDYADLNETAWITKILSFDNETLDNVVEKIEEVYFVELKVDEKLKSRKISAVYYNQPIEMILQILASTLNVDINEIEKNNYEMVSKIE